MFCSEKGLYIYYILAYLLFHSGMNDEMKVMFWPEFRVLVSDMFLSVVRLSVLQGQHFYIEHYMQTLQCFSHACHVYGHLWLLLFHTSFSGLDLGWKSVETKNERGLFLATCRLIRMKLGVLLKQFELNILILLLNKILVNREISALWLFVSKNFSNGRHSP